MNNSAIDLLLQTNIMDEPLGRFNNPWTVIYHYFEQKDYYYGRYVTFAQPDMRSSILDKPEWDYHPYYGHPHFCESFSDGTKTTTYHRREKEKSFEPLVTIQRFNGIVPDTLIISEEFILLMNLWLDPKTKNYYLIGDDGSKEEVIKVSHDKIEIRTPILRRYQAAKQLDLVVFTDSSIFVESDINEQECKRYTIDELNRIQMVRRSRHLSVVTPNKKQKISRVLTKYIISPPPQEQCGIQPWEEPVDYPSFVIGEDHTGKAIQHSCDNEKLAGRKNSNASSPAYLTPVFFKPEVLRRYYDEPDIYVVSDGYLSCANQWGVEIDNTNPDLVAVYLGDIGQKIPSSHWPHWLSYNVPPTQSVGESYFRRSRLNQWVKNNNPEHRFKQAYKTLHTEWFQNWGWHLYRTLDEQNTQVFNRLRIPLNESDTEFSTQILNLALVLVDLLNEKDISSGLENINNERGISKLERFLTNHSYPQKERDIALLRRIQTLRSRTAAHASNTKGQEYLKRELGNNTKRHYFTKLMEECATMIESFCSFTPAA